MRVGRILSFVVIPSVCLVLLSAGVSRASSVTIPHTFAPNTPALASEVNENFAAVGAGVNDNHARITALEDGTFGGVARAALVYNPTTNLGGPGVVRMFNHLPGGATPVVTRSALGQFEIDFGADVSSRFYLGSMGGVSFQTGVSGTILIMPTPNKPNVITVHVKTTAGVFADLDFSVVVF
jgi:hypothetical protein